MASARTAASTNGCRPLEKIMKSRERGPTRTLPEPFSLCDSERLKVLSLNRMDDLSSLSKVVHRALRRHGNGATVITDTEAIGTLI
jgi:hypothetical protein